MKCDSRKERRDLRHLRIRAKIKGTAERPRMAIMVSNKHIHVQFIDDEKGFTIVSVSTKGHEDKKNQASASLLGKRAVEAAHEKGIKQAVVDRGGYKFHGRVKTVVDVAVKAGLVAGATTEEK
jgi:large subunit ribosomal protein L18